MINAEAPFYGRERELEMLRELLDSNVARLIVLRGRRRIGKSRLAEQFGHFFDKHFTFVGLPPEKHVTDEIQRRHFANENDLKHKDADIPTSS